MGALASMKTGKTRKTGHGSIEQVLDDVIDGLGSGKAIIVPVQQEPGVQIRLSQPDVVLK